MKAILTLFVLLGVIHQVERAVVAQSATAPIAIDWRFTLKWDNPNDPGLVTTWIVAATNSTVVRTYGTPVPELALQKLLTGYPAGNYALNVTPQTASGENGPVSTNLWVKWPGGDGHKIMLPPKNLRTGK